jgi:glyoxylase-like metal-dependent hydrolase (beta-lactamase superfamily II)
MEQKMKLYPIETGRFALDGGAMFGIIPRPLWEHKIKPDQRNRIPLALRALLIEAGERRILIDTGIGEKWSPKERDIYAIDHSRFTLEGSLLALGLACDDITDVIITHLHFDHAGGAVKEVNGKLVPTFPRARYHIQQNNLEWALEPTERDVGSYLKNNVEPLIEAGVINPVLGEQTLFRGVSVKPVNGHTSSQQIVFIETGKSTVIYCGDLIPTSAHIPPAWIMGYDLNPLQTLEEKRALLKEAVNHDWILFFEHDPEIAACRVMETPKGFARGEIVDVEAIS